MRKNRFLAIQKMAEQKKNEALHASNANINNESNNIDLGPKQTVSTNLFINSLSLSFIIHKIFIIILQNKKYF